MQKKALAHPAAKPWVTIPYFSMPVKGSFFIIAPFFIALSLENHDRIWYLITIKICGF